MIAADATMRSPGVNESWLKGIRSQIEREEYRASLNGRGLQAPNRAHNLRTYFRNGGIEVLPRTETGVGRWSLTWQTKGWGRTEQDVAACSRTAVPSQDGARVIYEHQGLEEWYANKAEGLEQGFTLRERPRGNGSLRIEGALGGSLRAAFRPEEEAIDLLDAGGGPVLRYAGLRVQDASGREISSHLELAGNEVALSIDDRDATYPLTVDPILTAPSWTAESAQASAQFGYAVWTAGDVNGDGYSDVIVGDPYYDNGQSDEGRAFVYHGSPAGLSDTAAWTAEGGQTSALFAMAVGPAGDVNRDGYADVIIGAPYYDNGQSDEGRAYVYLGSSGGLSMTPAWVAESDQGSAHFGCAVATAGDVDADGHADVIVGARDHDNGQTNEGRAYLYHGNAGGLSTNAAWTSESNQANAGLGCSVSSAGDINGDGYADVIVGARGFDNGQVDEGRAYVYIGSSGGLALSPIWTGEGNQEGAGFGYAVAAAGDVSGDGYADILVGAPGFTNGQTDEGRACLYYGSPDGIGAGAVWTAESDQASAYFGAAVASAGDVNGDGYADVIIGAYAFDHGQLDEGRAYVYCGSDTGPASTPIWTADGDQESAWLGASVGTAGDVNGDGYSDVIVGACKYDQSMTDEGRALVYNGSAGGLASAAGWAVETNVAGALSGFSVGTAGDVNGDGYSDVIVGAPFYDGGQTDEGRAYVYLGSATGLSTSAPWSVEGNQANARFGWCVATAGDVDGNGCSDVIVGAPGHESGQVEEGGAFVYLGSSGELSTVPAWTAEGDQEEACFGYSAGTAGDVNGDGISDVVVGAPYYSDEQAGGGRAFLYLGSRDGLSPAPAWIVDGDLPWASLGSDVGTAGDVNGDGFSDVVVGAPQYGNGFDAPGRVFVYDGFVSGLGWSPSWTMPGEQAMGRFGASVATAGDVNGDGFSDVVIGAYAYSNGESSEGRAYAYLGSSSGLSTVASWTAEGNQATAWFGQDAATAGDVNGDGYSDVIVGAYWYDNGQTNEGRALLYLGTPAGLSADAAWTAEGDQAEAALGRSVGAAGDVNGDGYADVIVGADSWDNGQTDEGRALVYYGNSGGGLDRIPRQAQASGAGAIWLLGRSDAFDGFRLKALGRTAGGRGQVCLQYEVKPAGIPFNGLGLVTGTIHDTGAPESNGSAVALYEVATGLTGNTLYHWRLRVASASPFFPRSPWFSLPYNGLEEADVRTAYHPSDIADGAAPADHLELLPGSPNPSRTSTTLVYTIPRPGHVRLDVMDVTGREVAVLVDREEEAGRHTITWSMNRSGGTKLPAGVYFARIVTAEGATTARIVLAR